MAPRSAVWSDKENKMMKKAMVLLVGLTLLAGCDHLSREQQRALSGGAAIGALTK